MTTPVVPSFSDNVALIISEVQTARPELTFRDGDVTMAFAHANAAMFDAGIAYMARALRALYFGTATGTDLDTIIMDRLQLPRIQGTQAYGQLTFNRASGPFGTISAGTQFNLPMLPDGTVPSYTTDVDISFLSGAIANATVLATCTEYGVAGDRAGDATALTPASSLFDSSIVVTNPGGMAGGNDSETDEDYKARAVQNWQTQIRATLAAIETGALTVTGVSVAKCTEDQITGLCTCFVSDSNGNSTPQMCYLVRVALEAWRAAGVNIAVSGGLRGGITLSISIDSYADGFDVTAAAQQIKDSITTRCNRLQVGDDFTLDSIIAAAISPFPQDITKVHVASVVVNSVAQDATEDISGAGLLLRIDSITVVDGQAP